MALYRTAVGLEHQIISDINTGFIAQFHQSAREVINEAATLLSWSRYEHTM